MRRIRSLIAKTLYSLASKFEGDDIKRTIRKNSAISDTRAPTIGKNTRIYGVLDKVNPHLISIGNNSVIGTNSALLTHCPIKGPRRVSIGENVWIGYNALILPGVTIGNNSIVGAGSVVTKSFPEKSIIAGNPAKKLRSLDQQELKSLKFKLINRIPIGKDNGN